MKANKILSDWVFCSYYIIVIVLISSSIWLWAPLLGESNSVCLEEDQVFRSITLFDIWPIFVWNFVNRLGFFHFWDDFCIHFKGKSKHKKEKLEGRKNKIQKFVYGLERGIKRKIMNTLICRIMWLCLDCGYSSWRQHLHGRCKTF